MSFPKLEAFITEKLNQSKLPGVSAAIVKDGEVVWTRGFGARDLANGLPATPDTLYGLASVTKSFTCISIMQLAEQGKLSVDDPVEKHIPGFQVKPLGETVRIHHLMSHTSGLPALAYAEQVLTAHHGGGETPLAIYSAADLLDFMRGSEEWARHKPGDAWHYLNEGYALLGEIVGVVSGVPYTQYVTENILQPLGMTRTSFDKARWEADPDAAVPYVIDRHGERIPQSYTWGQITADGGLISSAMDMTRYLMMHLNGGELDGQRIISAESLREMQTSRITIPTDGNPFGQSGYGYGLGMVPDFLGQTVIRHGGSVGVATCDLDYIPEENLGIMVLGNGSGYAMNQFALYGLAEAMGHDPDELFFVQRPNRIDELTGVYEAYKGTMRGTVKRQGDFLILEFVDKHNTDTAALIPDELGEKVRTFYSLANGVKSPMTFTIKDDGSIEAVMERYMFRRVGSL